MEAKLRAAVAARRHPETFILARTDARVPLSLDEALRRAERYLKAGADGVYVEAVTSREELEQTGRALKGAALATTILEGGGKTPWGDPVELHRLGFSMLLHPTTVLFRFTRAIQKALEDLKAHRPMPAEEAVTFHDYEPMLGFQYWAGIEDQFQYNPKAPLELPPESS
jgi:2-methylisocitrate lyase-like PEP mutase family enzyme